MSTLSNIISSEATGPIEAKYHMKPLCVGGKKVCSNDHGQMIKMAVMHILVYGKNFKTFFFGTDWSVLLKLGIQHWALKFHHVDSNGDPRLTVDLFTQSSNLVPYAFVWGNA